jgi:diacyltrehalose acyltransferase
VIDYTMPKAVDSQHDNNKVVTTYDGLSDFPDRPDNLVSLANAAAGAALVHTPTAFTSPGDVPPTNIRANVNAKGGTTTTYLIPVDHLPLTFPLRYLGVPSGFVDQIDSVLQPMADAGYARNDNPATKPVSVDPVHGMDPIGLLDPATRDSITKTFGTIRGMIPSIG